MTLRHGLKLLFEDSVFFCEMSGVRGVVYFRFKHQPALEKVEFEASEISVGELKKKIAEKTLAKVEDIRLCELQNDGVNIKQTFVGDSELIASNTNLLVIRAPQKPGMNRIVVKDAAYFRQDSDDEGEAEQAVPAISLVPETALCPVCNCLMSAPSHNPLLFPCCGSTACSSCAELADAGFCPINGEGCVRGKRPILNKLVARQVEALVANKDNYDWRGFKYEAPPEPERPETAEAAALEIETIDLDSWEPPAAKVFDLDAEEVEVPGKKRKRGPRIVNLVKDEVKMQLKSEYSQEDIKKLFKKEVAAECSPLDDLLYLTVDFPRVLTREEFERWRHLVNSK